ncbi:hypothetical protein HDF16_002150 [Granulicella aggregans]|uniref:Uncharacterized protein n=1 Tax=Granulicella aggregans TaxID=474949 RepID=A0A7W7ZCK6_9BACT|nr:hypothetical protein [Granulicella aggregans]MBB5057444.1 hypothetical protein [Granulicella aggregans]
MLAKQHPDHMRINIDFSILSPVADPIWNVLESVEVFDPAAILWRLYSENLIDNLLARQFGKSCNQILNSTHMQLLS